MMALDPAPATAVTNSAFLRELARGAPKGSTLWVTAFGGSPDLTDAANWAGRAYNAATMAATVDKWGDRNTYFSVGALVPAGDGEIRRRKTNFTRLLALVADDFLLDDIRGAFSYCLETSPGKSQVGIFIDIADKDAARPDLVDRLMQCFADRGLVRADSAGNNIVRYVRLPVGTNHKPRETGPWTHRMAVWRPEVRLSLADAAAAFGIDLEALRSVPAVPGIPASDGNGGTQADKLRELTRSVVSGDSLHDSLNVIAASLVATKMPAGAVVNLLRGLMDASKAPRDERFRARYEDIPRAVSTAEAKFSRGGLAVDPETGEILEQPPTLPVWAQTIVGWVPKSAEQLTAVPPVEWLLEGWMQRGLAGAIVAEGGTGKTTTVLLLMCCIATGQPFLGVPVARTGAAILLSLDDSQGDLDAALAEIVQAGEWSSRDIELIRARVRVLSLRGVPERMTFATVNRGAVEPTGLELQLVDVLRQIPDLALVTLDTLRMFSGGDSSDERAMTIATQALTYMADKLDCATMATHHMGKGQSRDDVDDQYVGAGSSAIGDNLRFILRLKRTTLADIGKVVQITGTEPADGNYLRLSSQRGSLRVRSPEPVFFLRDGYALRRVGLATLTNEQQDIARFRVFAAVIDQEGGEVASKTRLKELVGGKGQTAWDDINRYMSRSRGWLEPGTGGRGIRVSQAGRVVLQ